MIPSKRRTSTALVVLTVLLLGTLFAAPAQGQTQKRDDTLVVRDLPAKVRLVPGERVRITLPTNVTTGYTWFADGGCCTAGNKPVVRISKGTYRPSKNPEGLVGAPGETTWTIRALRPGRTTVNIITRPPGVENTMQDETVGTLRITVTR
jgi:predicted secreted protein